MTDKQFDKFWADNRQKFLQQNTQYREASEKYGSSPVRNFLTMAIPIAAGIMVVEHSGIEHEILKWVVSAVVTVVCFVACVWVRQLMTRSKTPSEIEEDIRRELKRKMTDDN